MSIDPKILRRMQGEDAFLQSQTRGSRRVKLQRGQNWIVRFLPAQLGPENLFFARIARHWLGKLPIVCPRNTAEDFDGDPDCECLVCQVAESLNESPDENISKFGYKARANPQFLTYCLVWEKDGVVQPMTEVLNPYEFWHYRSTWEELKGFYVSGGRKCPASVLDYEQGNDFSVNKTVKGMRLDKLDSSPIFEANEPKYAEWIKKLEAGCKTPKVIIPTHEQMQNFAAKVQEAADRGGVTEDENAPRSRRPQQSEVDDEDAPRSRRPQQSESDEAPFRPPARRSAAKEEDDLDYGKPSNGAAKPASRARAAEPEEEAEQVPRGRPAPRARAAAEEVVDQEVPRPSSRKRMPDVAEAEPEPAPIDDEPEPEEVEPRRQPRAAAPVTPRAAAMGAPRLAPTARRAAAEAEGSMPQEEAEEEDQLPLDDKDTVSPAATSEVDDEALPPAVARKGGQGTALAQRLAKMPRGA